MHNKRREKIIDSRFQFGLFLRLSVGNILAMLVFGILMYIVFSSELKANLASAHTTFRNMQEMALPIILTLTVLNIIILSVVSGLAIVIASHRLAGPLYRLKTALNEMSEGKLDTLTKIREKDQLGPVAESLGALNTQLKDDFQGLKEAADQNNHDKIKEILDKYSI